MGLIFYLKILISSVSVPNFAVAMNVNYMHAISQLLLIIWLSTLVLANTNTY